jgi:hypothetical protein
MITISKELSNLGGIARIWLIPSRLISSAHYNFPTTLLQLPMNWDTDAWELTPVFQSASWTQEQQSTIAGTYYENTVAFKLPKVTYDSRSFISLITNETWTVMLMDQNKQFLLMGSQEYPMRSTIKTSTGSEISDLNHLAVTISGKSPILPVFIEFTL